MTTNPYWTLVDPRLDPRGIYAEAKLLKEMVGTTRFELATSPTPRVRSTRLSHVPTCVSRVAREDGGRGILLPQVYTRLRLSRLVRGCDEFLRQRPAFAFTEEEAVHLFH
jgi:hypothetical protein